MSDLQSINDTTSQQLTALHANTCLMMTRFINGHHCPKLAHLIAQQLGRLMTHPALQQLSPSQDMYRELMEHWQQVASSLLEQQQARRQSTLYH